DRAPALPHRSPELGGRKDANAVSWCASDWYRFCCLSQKSQAEAHRQMREYVTRKFVLRLLGRVTEVQFRSPSVQSLLMESLSLPVLSAASFSLLLPLMHPVFTEIFVSI